MRDHILISDKLKPHAKEAVRDLKKAGTTKTVMLTGDMKRVADKVAEELEIGEVYSELLPADKVAESRGTSGTEIRERKTGIRRRRNQ